MMRMTVLLFVLCTLFGCSENQDNPGQPKRPETETPAGVSDWRHGNGVCKLHKIKMETVVVHGLAGPAPLFTPDYYDASETFPNCGIEYPPELYSDEKGMIYVCPKCEEARWDSGW